jgi:hypothetical protein
MYLYQRIGRNVYHRYRRTHFQYDEKNSPEQERRLLSMNRVELQGNPMQGRQKEDTNRNPKQSAKDQARLCNIFGNAWQKDRHT